MLEHVAASGCRGGMDTALSPSTSTAVSTMVRYCKRPIARLPRVHKLARGTATPEVVGGNGGQLLVTSMDRGSKKENVDENGKWVPYNECLTVLDHLYMSLQPHKYR